MATQIDAYPDKRLLFAKITPPIVHNDTTLSDGIQAFAQQMNGVFFLVSDVSQLNMSFTDIVFSMTILRRIPGADQIRIIAVGDTELLRFGAEAAKQKQYGEHNIKVFNTVEDAMNYAENERKALGL